MKLKINVTEEHIKNGQKSITTACPVALAVLAVTGYQPVAVGVHMLYASNRCWEIPSRVGAWIVAYDNGEKVEPIEFELE